MRLEIRSKGLRRTSELRNEVERRVRFALARFGDRVRWVRVQLWDENGPKGGEDIRCRILASLAPRGELVVEEAHSRPLAAVAVAADRVAHSLSRRLGRLHAHRSLSARAG